MCHSKKSTLFPSLLVVSLIASTAFLVGCASTRTVGSQVDDLAIVNKIEAKLVADPQTSAFNIDVDSNEGTVRLSGTVKTEAARREAEELASRTAGVKGVINDLEVGAPRTAGERIDDSTLTAKIRAKLASDPEIRAFDIEVDSKQGVVTLTGRVKSAYQKGEAAELVRRTPGVVELRNLLEVAATAKGS